MNLFDLMATISLNTSGYESGINDVESGANEANSAMNSIDTDPAERGLDEVGEAAGEAGDDLDEFSSDADSVDLDSLGDEAASASSDIDDMADSAGSAGDDIDDMADAADSAGDDLSSMGDDASGASDDIDSMADSADAAADSLDSMGDSASGAVEGVEGLGDSMGGTLTSGSTEASNAMGAFSSAIEGFKTGGLVGGVVASIEAVGTAIYNTATETQSASAIIAQGTGATGETLEEFTTIAKGALADVQLAASTDLESVAETLAETNTRFGLTGDALQDTTTKMEDFAAITGQTGAEAVDALADVMGKWHMETEDMPGLMDQLTAAAQASGASASDLEASLSANSAAFNEMGMSMDDSIALMAAFEQAGGNASDMNKVLKSAISNLNGEVDDMPGAFMDAIEAIENADDATDALNAQVGDTGMTVEDVFGTKNANTIIQTCQSSSFSIEDMQDVLENCNGAMEQTAEDSVTFKDKVQGAFNGLKEGCRNAWQNIKGFFTDTKETGEEAGDGLVEGLSGSASDVEAAGEEVGQAVIDGVSDTLETHSPSKVMEEVGGNVTEGLSNGMKDMPSKIGSLLSDVMAGFTSFGKDSEKSASSTGTGFVSNMKSGLSNLTSTVSSPLKSALSNATGWNKDMSSEASSSGSNFVDKMKSQMSYLDGKVKSELTNVTNSSKSWGSNLSTEFNSMGVNVISGMINGIGSMVGNLYTSIQNSLSGLVDRAKGALGISSPSKVFRDEVGAMIGEGLALGIEDTTGDVEDAIDGMVASTDVGDIPIGTVSASAGGGAAAWNDNFDKLFDLLGKYLPAMANMQIVMDTGATVGVLAPAMNKKLGEISSKEARR